MKQLDTKSKDSISPPSKCHVTVMSQPAAQKSSYSTTTVPSPPLGAFGSSFESILNSHCPPSQVGFPVVALGVTCVARTAPPSAPPRIDSSSSASATEMTATDRALPRDRVVEIDLFIGFFPPVATCVPRGGLTPPLTP